MTLEMPSSPRICFFSQRAIYLYRPLFLLVVFVNREQARKTHTQEERYHPHPNTYTPSRSC